ncbi:hypothetical protein PhCBS80983_g01013 [Powellomyces hirtus]|uniref:Methyltransferase domain-containing protein n=1 Tax=Powellomyces hirtus TaxID=109895 RepID=A0A507EE57_9FUNG|nr:hypothetical protein PhCBS80983_g01013 [Powellomyces hirtus]
MTSSQPPPLTLSHPSRPILAASSNFLTVQSHYSQLLTEHYSWMFGGYANRLAQNRALLLQHVPSSVNPGTIAVDLGCGPGYQTLNLLEFGYHVVAVDASRGMLDELEQECRAAGFDTGKVTAVEGDLLNFREEVQDGTAGCIVCMGDSPTHLASLDEVRRMIMDSYAALAPHGRLILQFRDMTHPLEGTDRFIPVRSDAMTVFTCFLEWENDNNNNNNNTDAPTNAVQEDGSGRRVKVHDLVHVKKGNSTWELCKSWYYKLAMSQKWVASALTEAGFRVEIGPTEHGMQLVLGIKTA